MHVVLIGTRPLAALGRPAQAPPLPTLALYYLAAVLRRAGHIVSVVDPACLSTNQTGDCPVPRLGETLLHADVVGLSASTAGWPIARRVIAQVKQRFPKLPLVVGGLHATHLPGHILSSTLADFVIRGEAELTFPALLELLARGRKPERIPGIAYRLGDAVVVTPGSPLLSLPDLESMPDPAFDLLPPGAYSAIGVETSRGCSHACLFCAIMHKRSHRALSPCRAAQRIAHACRFADRIVPVDGVRRIGLVDDSFATDKARARSILGATAAYRALGIEFFLEARATDLDPSLIEALAAAPICGLQIGVECGYDAGLRAIGKGLSTEALERCAASLAAAGLIHRTLFSFIIGFPWEGTGECLATLGFAARMAAEYGADCHVSWLHIYPGSRLWDRRTSLGVPWGPEFFDNDPPPTTDPIKRMSPRLTTADIEDLEHRASLCGFLSELSDRRTNCGRMTFAPFTAERRDAIWQ
ncbi:MULTISPECIES: B12-binding domain-containing radical SAM protein [unclassified Anaeromyxobacter]|uniref:B12-binding domain-containing radical SAM protein n=1 Tax=unclassified Anaeromyxobacter TaxID=2620896 RepID=UPI001F572598|nr:MULTISPECIES: radical SAM protein [unclassified Anaeromyxobacter]